MVDELRRQLEFKVEQHYRDTSTFRDIMKNAYSGAQLTYQKVKDDIQDQRIKNLESMLNKNQSMLGFILELGISLIIGPAFGHLTEYGLNKMCGKIIRSREDTKRALDKFQKASGKVLKNPGHTVSREGEYYKILHEFWNDEMGVIQKKNFSFLMDIDFKKSTPFLQHHAASERIKGITDEIKNIQHFVLLTPVFNDMMQVLSPTIWSYLKRSGTPASDVSTLSGFTPEAGSMRGINTTDPAHFFKDIVEREIAVQNSIDYAQYQFYKEFILPANNEDLLKRTIEYFDRLDYFPQDGLAVDRIKKDLEFIYTCILFILTYGPPLGWGSDSEPNLFPTTNQKRYYREPEYAMPSTEDLSGGRYYFIYKIDLPRPAVEVLLNEVNGYFILGGVTFTGYFGLKRTAVNPTTNKFYHNPDNYEGLYGDTYTPTRVTDPRSTDYSLDDFIFASTQNWIHENIYIPFLESRVMFDEIKKYALSPQ